MSSPAAARSCRRNIFPFLFITIMCGAISGFHSLVSSGTTPKMIRGKADARTIGYGAMLIEGLVGVVAMIAAATLPPGDYYAMNTTWRKFRVSRQVCADRRRTSIICNAHEHCTQESLRGRSGGAVTLAVGMAHIFRRCGRANFVGGGGRRHSGIGNTGTTSPSCSRRCSS